MHYNLTLWGRPLTYSTPINACFVHSHFESQSWHSFWPAWLLWQNLQYDPVRGICLVLVGVALNVALLCFWCCFGCCFGCFLDVALAKSTRWPSAMHLLSVGGCGKWCNGAMEMVQDDPVQHCICLVLVDVARRDNPTLSRIMAPGAGHPSPTPSYSDILTWCWVT